MTPPPPPTPPIPESTAKLRVAGTSKSGASKSTSAGRNVSVSEEDDRPTEPDAPTVSQPRESSLPTVVGEVTGKATTEIVRRVISGGRDNALLLVLTSVLGGGVLGTVGPAMLGWQPSINELAEMKADAIEVKRRLDDVEVETVAIEARTHESEYRGVVIDRLLLDRLDRIDGKLGLEPGPGLPQEIDDQFTEIEDEHKRRDADEREARAMARAEAAAARRGTVRE